MNRREFIQRAAALAATLALGVRLPGEGGEEPIEIAYSDNYGESWNQVVLVGFGIDGDDFAQCVGLGDFHTTMEKGAYVVNIESTLDIKRALDAAYFTDTNGNRYPYREIERIVEAAEQLPPLWPMEGDGDTN